MLKLTRSSFKFLFSDANSTVSLCWVGWGKKKKKLKLNVSKILLRLYKINSTEMDVAPWSYNWVGNHRVV